MKISVIVTTYNRPDALIKVLQGLRFQSRAPEEVIVADDGSGYETTEAIRHFSYRFPSPIFHIRHEDMGFRAAMIRNKAILKSSGEYIVLLDGDCIPSHRFLQDHMALAEKGCFFQGKRVLIQKRLANRFTRDYIESVPRVIRHIISGDISNAHHLIRMPDLPARYPPGLSGIRSCNMGFFRKDIFAVNGFNEDFVGWGREDTELSVRFYRYGLKRKEHPFMAVCFHLWHEAADRNHLAGNDDLLKKTIDSNEYICANGLFPHRKAAF